jgi:hypothetical protein
MYRNRGLGDTWEMIAIIQARQKQICPRAGQHWGEKCESHTVGDRRELV